MSLWLEAPDCTVFHGSALEELQGFEDESVQCCVTSPPYWGLRDYKTPPQVWGGDPVCEHEWGPQVPGSNRGGSGTPTDKNNRGENYGRDAARGNWCQSCGAWLGSLGLEPTPELYVEHAVTIFREVRRTLRKDGTLWLNIGDSYSNDTKWGGKSGGKNYTSAAGNYQGQRVRRGNDCDPKRGPAAPGQPMRRCSGDGLKPKDLVGIPWMLAFALRADGWWLRQEIIWNKLNAMPEPVKDRCVKSHEHLFLLAKAARYHFDFKSIEEPAVCSRKRGPALRQVVPNGGDNSGLSKREPKDTRNKRSVWGVNTQSYKGAHFATFPPKLIEPCILAGCPVGGLVLDPFAGSGTTLATALSLGRRATGIELQFDYLPMIQRRIEKAKLTLLLS